MLFRKIDLSMKERVLQLINIAEGWESGTRTDTQRESAGVYFLHSSSRFPSLTLSAISLFSKDQSHHVRCPFNIYLAF
jgi:hypothetical protein